MIGYLRGQVTHIFLDACFIDVHGVGDCHDKAADINRAIEEGYLAANAI